MPPKELGAGSQRWLCDRMTGLGPEPLIYSLNKHSARQPQVANSLVGGNISTQGNPNVPDTSSFASQGGLAGPSPTSSTGVFKSPGASSLPRLDILRQSGYPHEAVSLTLHSLRKDFNIPFGTLRIPEVLK